MTLQSGATVYEDGFRAGWAPDPRVDVSTWADENRILGGRSGDATHWRTDITPYLRDIMNALGPHSRVKRVVVQAGGQIGKTEAGNNWLGYIIDRTPAPILVMRPTGKDAIRYSRQRLAPMIKMTPCLSKAVTEARSRDGGNSALVKEFAGGVMFLVGSNSTSEIKSMPIRFVFADEVDEYPGDIAGQGDPLSMAEKRTTGPTFSRRKIFITSTPTIKGLSRVEREFLKSDRRRFFIPCPYCGNFDFIRWENIRWEERDPDTARLCCVKCDELIEERFKPQMLAGGQWRATGVGDGETIGFHVSALYSPLGWYPWRAAVAEFLEAKEDPFKLKNWVNHVLGETWEERGDTIDAEDLIARAERYPADVPNGVGLLVGSVDVQDDRLEASVWGFGGGEETWLVAFSQFHGDPGTPEPWFELDRFLLKTFEHENGRPVGLSCVAIDSGGHHTEAVYRFCKARIGRRVFAIRGGADKGKPVVGRPSTHNRYRTKLFTLCVDTAKEIIMSRLQITREGAGFVHLPEWIDGEFVAQLTAEKAVRRWKKGRGSVREWIKIRDRNEALDLFVYAIAALYILGPEVVKALPALAEKLALPPDEEGGPKPPPASSPPKVPRPGGFVSGWRGR
jgi:phage terminase large subunit GpA-like protein